MGTFKFLWRSKSDYKGIVEQLLSEIINLLVK